MTVALFAIFALGVVVSAQAMAAEVLCVETPGVGLWETLVSATECSKSLTTANSNFELITELLAEWLFNGGAVTTELLTETTGELLLEDNKVPILGKAAVVCSGILDGWIGPGSLDWVSEVLLLNGTTVVSTTPLTGEAVSCTDETNCEEPLLWAVHLGWQTEVELWETESLGTFFINLILPHEGGENPGWEIECMKSIVGAITDECTAPEAAAELTLEGATLLGTFSEAITLLAGLALGTCTQGGANSGVVVSEKGGGVIALNGGGEPTASSEGVGGVLIES